MQSCGDVALRCGGRRLAAHGRRIACALKPAVLAVALGCAGVWSGRACGQQMELHAEGQPAQHDVPRIGVNLGSQTSWGAEQLTANILANPGFEATHDGAIVVVHAVSGTEFTDDAGWLARPASFWKGARFSVRTGRLAGVEGRILESGLWQGLPHFRASCVLTGLAPGDVVALEREGGSELPSHWWWQNPGAIRASGERRPQSEGRQSLLMSPDLAGPADAISYIDQISDRAGKLLLLRGAWEAGFWARSIAGGRLTVQLRRVNGAPFLRESVQPGVAWRHYSFRFSPLDTGPPAGLEFRLEAEGVGSQVWVDDVSLAQAGAPQGGFRTEVAQTLSRLRPGYLRDWQGQLGDSFANRIASQWARQPFRYRPGDETAWGYSLPDFFELCHQVDAQPWIVLPVTLTDEEWTAAGAWIKGQIARYGFREVVVEFGNENWNGIFRPAGIQDATRMQEAAERGFRFLNQAAGNDARILPAIGGQFVNPAMLKDASRMAPSARLLAVAPYYARSLRKAGPSGPDVAQLFTTEDRPAEEYGRLARQSGKQLAIYEMNAHSMDGDATPVEASALVTGQAAGTAILFHALRALEQGATRQCLFTLAAFDTFRSDGTLIRLFGLARDLTEDGRLRPTGLAMELANRAIGGDAWDLTPARGTDAQAARDVAVRAFRGPKGWSVVAASASPHPTDLVIDLPAGQGPMPRSLAHLTGPGPMASNEDGPQVKLSVEPAAVEGNRLRIHLDPFGAAAAYSEPTPVPDRNTANRPNPRR